MEIRLGDYVEVAQPLITPLGITVFEHGLTDYGKKRVKKAANKMIEEGVAPYIIEQFRVWALSLPAQLTGWIDDAYYGRMEAWKKCVGMKLPNGRTISEGVLAKVTPTSFRIILHKDGVSVPQGIVAGASWTDRVEVVAAYLSDGNTWLRKCDALVGWEIGNLIGIRHGYTPRDVSKEIGDKSPC